VAHCATRLRFTLKNRDRADKPAVETTRGVITVVEAGGQFQVVIGNTVPRVYEALVALGVKTDVAGGTKVSFANRAMELITSMFTPVIWVLAATGLIRAMLVLVNEFAPDFAATHTHAIIFATADAVFQFLPVFLAITAARRFKANQFTAVAVAAALIYSATIPVISNADGVSVTLLGYASTADLTFAGIPVVMVGYLSAVLPIIGAVYLLSKVEALFSRVIHESIRNFLVPALSLLIVVPATLLAVGPALHYIANGVADGVTWLWGLAPAIGGAVFAALWQVFVIFGVHHGFVPVINQQLSMFGYTMLIGPIFAAVLAQAGATTAVYFKTRNKAIKGVASTAAVTAFVAGVTEPAIYGVNLRLKRPFIFGVIGATVGGAIIAGANIGSSIPGVFPGILTLPAMNIGSLATGIIGTVAAAVIAFTLTMVFGFTDVKEPPAPKPSTGVKVAGLAAPVNGEVVPLDDVPDDLFRTRALGDGIAFQPADGRAVAPLAGVVVGVLPHAYGIRAEDGTEVLVHIGINTVAMNGEGFTSLVAEGDHVAVGDTLATFDLGAIKAAGHSAMTVMLLVENPTGAVIAPTTAAKAQHGDLVLNLA